MAIHTLEAKGFHYKPTSCSACRPAGRMAIHAMEALAFIVPPSCLACRAAGRMAIHAMEALAFIVCKKTEAFCLKTNASAFKYKTFITGCRKRFSSGFPLLLRK